MRNAEEIAWIIGEDQVMNNIKNIPEPKFIPSSPKKTRTNGDSIRALNNEQLAEWIEDYVQKYINFWVNPDHYLLSNRESDLKILLEWLNEKIPEEEVFYF